MNTAEMMPSSMDSPPSLNGLQQPGSLPAIDQISANQDGEPTSPEREGISPQAIDDLIEQAGLWASGLHAEQGIVGRVASSVAAAIDKIPENAIGAVISTEVKTTVSETTKSSVSSSIEVTDYVEKQTPSAEEVGGDPVAAIIAAQAVMGSDYYVTGQWLEDKVVGSENILTVFDSEYAKYVAEVDGQKAKLALSDSKAADANTEVSPEDLQDQAKQIAGILVEYDVVGQVAKEIIRDKSIELMPNAQQYLALITDEEVEALDGKKKPSDGAEPTDDILELNDLELPESEVDKADREHPQAKDTEEITTEQLEDILDDDDMVRALSQVAKIYEEMSHLMGGRNTTDELLDDMLAAAQIVDITDSDGEVTNQVVEQLRISAEDHVNMLEVVSVVKTEIERHPVLPKIENDNLIDLAEEVEDTQETVQQAVVIISAAAMENITNTLDAVGEEEATQTIIVLTSYYSQILASINHHIATSAIDDLIDRVNGLVSLQAEADTTLINIMAQKEWALEA
jgi:hypothetical protein